MPRSFSSFSVRSMPFAVVTIMLVVALGIGGSLRAQEATPGASGESAATPIAGNACGPILGLGDESVACINIVHALSDVQAVDIVIDGTPAITGLPSAATSGFVPVPADTYALQVTAASDLDSPEVLVEIPDLTVEAGLAYEILAVGSREDDTTTLEILPVDLAPLGDGEARVRVFHAVDGATDIDIARADGGEVMVSALAPMTATEYLTVQADSLDLEGRSAGSDDVLFTLGTQTLVPNTVVSLIVIGTAEEPTSIMVLPIVIALSGTTPVATPVAAPDGTPVATPVA